MPDKLLDQNGRVHEKNIVGDWVPTQRNGLWPEKDVGLLGPNIERGWDGGPKAARTWSGGQQRARSGSPLFMPRVPSTGGGESLEAIILQFAVLVIWVMIAVAILAIWVTWRFIQSLGADLGERRLTASTVLWGIPVAAMAIGLLVAALAPHGGYSTYTGSGNGGGSGSGSGSGSGGGSGGGSQVVIDPALQQHLHDVETAALSGTCEDLDAARIDDVEGSSAGVLCDPAMGGVDRVVLYAFASRDDLEAMWRAHVQPLRSTTLKRGADCTGRSGRHVRDNPGAFACFASDGHGHVRWADWDQQVYGVLDMADGAAPAAVDWWLDNLAS